MDTGWNEHSQRDIIDIMDFNLHTTFPEELRDEWNNLLARSITNVPFLRHEYLSQWWQTRGGGEWPDASLTLVTARRDGALVGIAPLFCAQWQGRTALMLLGSIEISDYLDLIVSPADLEEFITGLLGFLKSDALPAWQALDLYNFLDDTPVLAALEQAASGAGLKLRVEKLQHSPHIPLPGDWETYLAGIDKKQRHEIRRKMRRAVESEAQVEWYFVQDPAAVEAEVDDFLELMRMDEEKRAFLTEAMSAQMRNFAVQALSEGYLGLAFLTINGKKAAAYYSFDYLNRLWVYNSGINWRDFPEYSPGWVLLGELLRWANEQKREVFDFMRGDEEYKYRFGAVDRFVMRAVLER